MSSGTDTRTGARTDTGTDSVADTDTAPAPIVAILALPQSLASCVLGMLDAINLANAFHALGGNPGPLIDARILAQEDLAVETFGGRRIDSDALIDEIDHLYAIVVAPVVSDLETMITQSRPVTAWLTKNWKAGVTMTGVCTGTVLLAEAGILDNRIATTNPGLIGEFETRYPKIRLDPTLKLADEGPIVTAGATTSAFDLVIELIGRLLGPETAIRTATELLTDPTPQSQKPYMLARQRPGHADREVQAVQGRIEREYGEALDPGELARGAAMSPRTLARRFREATGESIQQYLRNTRIEAAMRRLAATEDPIAEITENCGYADPRSFRRTFRELTGLSPREYRERFSYARRAWHPKT